MRTPRIGIAAVVLAAAVATTAAIASAAPAGAATTTRRITVTGTGDVRGRPDIADVTIGVDAHARTAADALDAANDRAAKVIAALKDGGVADDDLQTTGLSIQPTYDNNGTITGYSVSNTVTARLRDLTKTGALLDATARVAGDEIRVQGISFGIDDDSALLATARARAVKRARAKAQQLADAAEVHVGTVVSIDETNVSLPYAPRDVAGGAVADAASIPVEPGSQTLTVEVTVVYSIA